MAKAKKNIAVPLKRVHFKWRYCMLCSDLFPVSIGFVIDDTTDNERAYDFACITCATDGSAPHIKITKDVYYDIKRSAAYARFVSLHELSHYGRCDPRSEKRKRPKLPICYR